MSKRISSSPSTLQYLIFTNFTAFFYLILELAYRNKLSNIILSFFAIKIDPNEML